MTEYLFIAQLDIPVDKEDEFNRLYDEEHVPNLLSVPGVSNARRYKLTDGDYGDMPRYLALYDLESPDIPESEEWQKFCVDDGLDCTEWVAGSDLKAFHAEQIVRHTDLINSVGAAAITGE